MGELETAVREVMSAFDRKDYPALKRALARDAQGVDEISRQWLRSDQAIDEYFRKLEPVVSDISSQVTDVREMAWDDTGLVTCWLDQTYVLEGQPHRISAPISVVLRREGSVWKVALMHAVPLESSP